MKNINRFRWSKASEASLMWSIDIQKYIRFKKVIRNGIIFEKKSKAISLSNQRVEDIQQTRSPNTYWMGAWQKPENFHGWWVAIEIFHRLFQRVDFVKFYFALKVALVYLDASSNINQYRCGGTLISEDFILTAGHCVAEDDQPIAVRLGGLNLNDPGSKSYLIKVCLIEKYFIFHLKSDLFCDLGHHQASKVFE